MGHEAAYVLRVLPHDVDKAGNKAQEDDRIHNILSGPLESVREVLLYAVVLLNPDVLVHSRFAEVSAEHSAHRLGSVLQQDTSAVHPILSEISLSCAPILKSDPILEQPPNLFLIRKQLSYCEWREDARVISRRETESF